MENAAIIRKVARDLLVQHHSLDRFGFEYVEYNKIVRELIEEYQLYAEIGFQIKESGKFKNKNIKDNRSDFCTFEFRLPLQQIDL